MNIFILSHEHHPAKHYLEQARYHCDKHVIKMILESSQMLCTTLVQAPIIGSRICENLHSSAPCKPLAAGMSKHPCVEWTKKSVINFNYLARLAYALCNEHQYRYPLSAEHEHMSWLKYLCEELDDLGYPVHNPLPEVFAVAVKDPVLRTTSAKHYEAVEMYRNYYFQDKYAFATWKGRKEPIWWLQREVDYKSIQ